MYRTAPFLFCALVPFSSCVNAPCDEYDDSLVDDDDTTASDDDDATPEIEYSEATLRITADVLYLSGPPLIQAGPQEAGVVFLEVGFHVEGTQELTIDEMGFRMVGDRKSHLGEVVNNDLEAFLEEPNWQLSPGRCYLRNLSAEASDIARVWGRGEFTLHNIDTPFTDVFGTILDVWCDLAYGTEDPNGDVLAVEMLGAHTVKAFDEWGLPLPVQNIHMDIGDLNLGGAFRRVEIVE